MAFDSRKRNHIQIGLTDDMVTDLTILTARIGREIGMRRLTRAKVATWVLHHLVTTKFVDAVAIVVAGQKREAKCLAGTEMLACEPASIAGHGTVGRHVPATVNGRAKQRALSHNKDAKAAI